MAAEPGRVMLVHTAEPGSTSAERLRLLASWATSQHVPRPARGVTGRPPSRAA
ncbi:hypothetical protein [Brachybacterium sp. HMSC06H03]|uniref:hypothetical protein n=1 Tax=Brachybacterium sp. HMSC06H03 TaxID=1581127 RepID=UPI001FED540C|nr:hypothetical protein [Brachybacterium sp. HMSC06H03]